MGLIIKQSLRGSVWSYLGVALGFVTTTYLYTEYLTPEVVGLFGLLVSISSISAGLSSLGMNSVTARLFPYFRDEENGHNGFFLTAIIPQIVGFVVFVIVFLVLKNSITANNIEKSPLFAQYVYLVIPISFFLLVFSFLDTYIRMLYNAVLGIFLKEFSQRVLIFLIVLFYVFKLISLNQLIICYAIAISFKAIALLFYLLKKNKINLRPNWGFISKKLRKEIIDVALFSIATGMGSTIVFSIDKIVINQMLDLGNTGIYTIAFFFGTLVIIPSRPLLKISSTLIAEAWKRNDIKGIKEIYSKSCINQFIIGGFLFLGIWANIDNILMILGSDYVQSKWVIFFIGLGYLFDMATGANGQIIGLSKDYRIALLFIVILIVLVLGLLYTLIPVWGITGAAIAIAVALFLNNLMRYIFLLRKYSMQPLNYRFIVVAAFYFVLYILLSFIPQQKLVMDILIRGGIITLSTGIFLFLVPVSEEMKLIVIKSIRGFEKYIRR